MANQGILSEVARNAGIGNVDFAFSQNEVIADTQINHYMHNAPTHINEVRYYAEGNINQGPVAPGAPDGPGNFGSFGGPDGPGGPGGPSASAGRAGRGRKPLLSAPPARKKIQWSLISSLEMSKWRVSIGIWTATDSQTLHEHGL